MNFPTFEQIKHRANYVDIVDYTYQNEITQTLVMPHLEDIKSKLLLYRAEVDSEFNKQAKPKREFEYGIVNPNYYPIGFCRAIRDKVLEKIKNDALFLAFTKKGVILKEIFIILRNTYFQNAIQLGNLYIDIANDTVDTSKPKLEICNLNKTDYVNLNEYDEYFRVAEKYLHITLYPNTLFPLFALMSPCLSISEKGEIQFFMHQEVILYKDFLNNFNLVKRFFSTSKIAQRQMPEEYKNRLRTIVQATEKYKQLYDEKITPTNISGIIENVQRLPVNNKIDYIFGGLEGIHQYNIIMSFHQKYEQQRKKLMTNH